MSGITITYEVVKKLKQTYIATYCLLFFLGYMIELSCLYIPHGIYFINTVWI